MFPFIPFNQGGHDQNLQQATLFNPNLTNMNTQMASLNGNNIFHNFHGMNPFLQPMNNQLGAVFPQQQLMALQLQELNWLNQLQSQGILLGQNPMLGLQNQLMQRNPMMGFVGNNPQMVPNKASVGVSKENQQQVYHAKVDSKNSSVISQNFANGSSTRKFPGFVKGESSHKRFQKFQSHDKRNPKEKNRQFNRNCRRGGEHNQRGAKLQSATSGEEPPTKPRFTITYSEKEIHQWREARKKNFPTRGNIDKQLASGSKSTEDAGGDEELRRQQLKEVLAKQAELGVEVAGIPPSREARKENFPTRASRDKQLKAISAKQAELDAAYLDKVEKQIHDMNNYVDDGEANKRKVMDANGPSLDKCNNKRRRMDPFLQPMNNQMGAIFPQQQLVTLQLQGLNMLNRLQSQGLLLDQNPMLGLQNQLMQGNPMMSFVGSNPQMIPNKASVGVSNANRQQVCHAKFDSKNSSVISQSFAKGSSTRKSPGFVKGESSPKRFQKFQSHDKRNPAEGKNRQFNRNGRRGEHNQRQAKLQSATSGEEPPTRPRFAINYSEKEIHRWREARKKNFPTRAKIVKQLASGSKSNEDAGGDDELRRQQLKDIEMQQWCEARKKNFPTRANSDKQLKAISAKQAEVGAACLCEVEKKIHDMNNNVDDGEVNKRKVMDANGPSLDKCNNRRRRNRRRQHYRKLKKKEWWKFKNKDAMDSSSIATSEPSLVQKLLSADVGCATEGSLSLNGADSAVVVGIFKEGLSGKTYRQKESNEADRVQNKSGEESPCGK